MKDRNRILQEKSLGQTKENGMQRKVEGLGLEQSMCS